MLRGIRRAGFTLSICGSPCFTTFQACDACSDALLDARRGRLRERPLIKPATGTLSPPPFSERRSRPRINDRMQLSVNPIGPRLPARLQIPVATSQGTSMPTTNEQTCEVRVEGAWCLASLTEVRRLYTMAQKRCPACHGQIMIAGSYIGSGRQKLRHRRSHTGCPLKSDTYIGTSSPHPQALA
ncbi:hypothetical protein Mrad2831_6381 (plasmid) [Methylobacterium radiotolerans JCM 2831]|uniref:Uncharacterized protein n=2 Tax=Methylobacterium radiotolerans (strain ATCC 27329 / DSM 1819 / JCM 2831 / NBRC 15690 / NCIMB 10815 / 0-1) TaxID=426355 RepID=B1M9X7_METRJ|nr:hypothetical protein Mrad2831_6381 [Methylobacterium radiotolerans JCM 2831]